MTDPDTLRRLLADATEHGWSHALNNCSVCALHDALPALLDRLDQLADAHTPEPRWGMVTVYHWDGHYLGCMGIETWREALASAADQEAALGEGNT